MLQLVCWDITPLVKSNACVASWASTLASASFGSSLTCSGMTIRYGCLRLQPRERDLHPLGRLGILRHRRDGKRQQSQLHPHILEFSASGWLRVKSAGVAANDEGGVKATASSRA